MVSFKTFNYVGYGMYNDIRSRLPYYGSDFTDAYNYRVVPSTLYIFFTNLLPALAFAQDLIDRTDHAYGVNETLLSLAMAGVIFGLVSGQPLCIVGVTGPVVIFSYTVYELIKDRGTPYFPFMCWIYIWSMVMHFGIAIFNIVSYLKLISAFSCDAFGFFICIVYLQKGVQILARQFNTVDDASGYCSVLIALLMVIFGVGSSVFGRELHYFRPWVRKVFVDYGVPASVIFFTGFIHFGGHLKFTEFEKLPITKSFAPSYSGPGREHGWFIHFWPKENIAVGDVFLALPFAILLTFLFYFDHNVSSLMCQSKQYPLKKPSAFHWDFFLLGVMTGIAGFLGILPPNGLIPQAPLHSDSLVVHDKNGKAVSVVEQRLTNTLQGAMTFVMMTRPFLVVLHLIPQAVLAGLFFTMGITGLHGNIMTNKIRYIFMDKDYILHNPTCPEMFKKMHDYVNKKWWYLYLLLGLVAGMAEFAISTTIAAVGFPGVLMFFAFCATWIWPLIFPKHELEQLDGEVADDTILKNLKIIDDIKEKDKEKNAEKTGEDVKETEDAISSSS